MANRVFLVPKEQFDPVSTAAGIRPKYSDLVDGYSGTIVNMDNFSLPLSGEWYLVRYYGTTTQLDDVQGKSDAHSRQEYNLTESAIATYLNGTFGQSRTFSEWMDALQVG